MSCRLGSHATSQALRQVFTSSTITPTLLRSAPSSYQCIQRRSYAKSKIEIRVQPRSARSSDPKSFGPEGYVKQIKDEDILSSTITLIDEKGNFRQAVNRNAVLRQIDRSKYFLVQVVKDDNSLPVCKVLPRQQVLEAEKASNSTGPKIQRDNKEVEIPWKAAQGDVDHKLKIARDFLDEGKKVDVVLIARRKREVLHDTTQAQVIVDQIKQKLDKLDQVVVTVAPESVLGRAYTFKLQGPAKEKAPKQKKEKGAKEIEILWNITDADLEKRQLRIAELLGAQIPVELVITAKKKAFQIPEEDGQKVLSRILASISKIPDAREIEPREGEPGKKVNLFLGTSIMLKTDDSTKDMNVASTSE